MLTAELVRVSRRKQQLHVVPRGGLDEARAAALLTELLLLCKEHHGLTRGALIEALDDVVVDVKEEKALRAAKKLVLDRLDFAERDDVDPPALRLQVFRAAADARRALTGKDADGAVGAVFDRDAVVDAVAKDLGTDRAALEAGLYADLEDAHVVDAAALPADGALLVDEWIEREIQALLLRSSEVTVDVDATPAQLRRLLRALKLHQLLFRVGEAPDDAKGAGLLRLIIDGPMGLFSSSTRYGMKLALLWPHIRACRRHHVSAQVQLRPSGRGRGGAHETFVIGGVVGGAVGGVAPANVSADEAVVVDELPPLVQGLLDELPQHLPGCLVAAAAELIAVDGHGALVPDVVVVDKDGDKAFVEVLGFWSRPAVWKRVELTELGLLPAPVVFCFSERLRVSEEALSMGDSGADERAALVAFKGTLSAKKVAEEIGGVVGAEEARAGEEGEEEATPKRMNPLDMSGSD